MPVLKELCVFWTTRWDWNYTGNNSCWTVCM